MPIGAHLHIVIPRSLKEWLEEKAREESDETTLSRYVRQVLREHRANFETPRRKRKVK
jgi:hypothetical protein